jgi:hypothetical protein
MRGVAQLVSAPRSGRGGRWFESSHPDQIFNVNTLTDVYVLEQQDIEFEVFISPKKENRVFSHICLSYQNQYWIGEICYNKFLIT